MNEVLFVMKEMIENNTILMNFVMLIILFNLLLMFFTYIYIIKFIFRFGFVAQSYS